MGEAITIWLVSGSSSSLRDCSNGCGVRLNINKEPFGAIRIDHIDAHVKEHCEPIGSLSDNEQMGRPKSFNREDVLKKAMPVFWRRGFADASLHELELATGVNKSGLYSEFEDKEDLFVQSLQYYLESLEKKGLLTIEPLGWGNIERFLKMGPSSLDGQRGCFAVSSMREFPILPPEAIAIVTRSRSKLKQLIAKNIEVEHPKMNSDSLAELLLTFFTGLQHGAKPGFGPCLHGPQNRGFHEHSPETVTVRAPKKEDGHGEPGTDRGS